MDKIQSRFERDRWLLVAAIAAFALAMAQTIQLVGDVQPCTFCVVQRYALWLVFFAALGLHFGARQRRFELGAVLLGGASGVVVGLLKVVRPPSDTCGRDRLADLLNSTPTAKIWPSMFEVRGACADQTPALLGLQLNTWAILTCALVLAVAFWPARRN